MPRGKLLGIPRPKATIPIEVDVNYPKAAVWSREGIMATSFEDARQLVIMEARSGRHARAVLPPTNVTLEELWPECITGCSHWFHQELGQWRSVPTAGTSSSRTAGTTT